MPNIKNIVLILILLFAVNDIKAQILNKLSMDVNVVRLAKEPGVFSPASYNYEFAYINGLGVGYTLSDQWNIYLGMRLIRASISTGFEVFEISELSGSEFNLGSEFSVNVASRLVVGFGIEYFREKSQQKGEYWDDTSTFFEINHTRLLLVR